MHCSLFQENKLLSNIIFNNKTDRHHYSVLLKENLQKSSVKKKRKLIGRDSEQASSQVQYHSNTKKKQTIMDGSASLLHLYQINFIIPIKKIVFLIFTPNSRVENCTDNLYAKCSPLK